MKIGFNQGTSMERSTMLTDLALCEQYGFDYIEIWENKLRDYLLNHTLDELKASFARSHLKPYSLSSLKSITFRNKQDYEKIKETLGFLCQVGEAIDCRTIMAIPTRALSGVTKTTIWHETVSVLRELGDIAGKFDIRIAFEALGFPDASVNTFAQALDIINGVQRENVGLVFDCYHFQAMGGCSYEALEAVAVDKLFAVHIADAEDLVPGNFKGNDRLLPGDGFIDFTRIFKTLARKGYQGIVSVELFRPEYESWSAEKIISKAKEKTERVLATYLKS